MSSTSLSGATVAVIGAGTMGTGIAQIAAQAGHRVRLHDAREGAAADAKAKLAATLDGLVAKGKLDAAAASATLARIEPARAIAELADAKLVVEAIVENLEVKRKLFAELEGIVAPDAVLATNTSSISVTAIARDLKAPQRLVGMHFFNPVPLMKLVEVVSGLRTERGVADAIFELSKAWGKVPVHTKSTPGFIVNRIARPYYAETLALLHEGYVTPEQADAALRAAGFRMGPCELMDLIGHDVNYAVTESVYAANYFDKRYVPSLVQRELVDGGLFGRKSGRGFYDYANGAPAAKPAASRRGDVAASAQLVLTDGRTAQQVAAETRQRDVAVFDWAIGPGGALAYAVAEGASEAFAQEVAQAIAAAGFEPLRIGDAPGLVVARTVAMLVNEAADAVQQGVCDPAAADTAMKLGVNYPAGPFEWLNQVGTARVVELLGALAAHYGGERYRTSPWLACRRLQERTA
ncbi:3-hydroxyacyl-CoA dehydrogenase NAD-binding domain-containing protein [Caldimonas sp. KR1-144]|uniref:3-hydroxyacyl-CoA dehydrogenase NAD-binding domain-containing protein n=1 Tax=Caldimonas sp. KR1-144 TaxID=3400911 RepID=UPI003C07E28F